MTSIQSWVKIITMKKLSLYIFLVLVFCNFTNTANAKVDGEGELYLSQDVIKNFINYIFPKFISFLLINFF